MFGVRRGAALPWKQTALPPEQMAAAAAAEGTGGLGVARRVPEMIICWVSLPRKKKKKNSLCVSSGDRWGVFNRLFKPGGALLLPTKRYC